MIRFEDLIEKVRAANPGRRHRAAPAGLRVFGLRAQGTGPPIGRALSRPPARGRRHPGRPAAGRRGHRRRACCTTSSRTRRTRSRRSASCSASRSRTSSRASPSCRRCSSRRARSGRPRASARCSWRWSTTSASSSSSSPIGCTTCGRCTTCPRSGASRIAQETRDIYAPIAHRLGMSKLKNELEELAFRHLEPAAYQALRAAGRGASARRPRA